MKQQNKILKDIVNRKTKLISWEVIKKKYKLNTVQIRSTTTNDADLIAPLFDAYRQFYKQKSDLKLAKRFISERLKKQESIIFLASLNQQPVGFVQLYPSFSSVSVCKILILNDLYVSPEARKHGVGKALMNEAKKYAVKKKDRQIVSRNR